MPRKKKKVDIIPEAQTTDEAMNYLFAGLKYFLSYHTKKTVLVLLIMAGSSLYVVFDYITSTKSKILNAEPISSAQSFSIVPQAMAEQNKNNPIVVNGKTYGYYDPDLQIWKDVNGDRFFVYNKVTGSTKWVEVESLNKSLK